MVKVSIGLLIFLTALPARAGWVEERWTDHLGNNYQGTVSPPSTFSAPSSHAPPAGHFAPAPQRGPTRQELEKQVADIKANGQIHFDVRNYDAALSVWQVGYDLCQDHGMQLDGCYALDQRMLTAMAYRDIVNQRRKKAAEAAQRRAAAEQKRRKAIKDVHTVLKGTTLDFDGTGKGIDLQFRSDVPPIPSTENETPAPEKGSPTLAHTDATVVDLRFLESGGSQVPRIPGNNPKGVRNKKVPPPAFILPKDPKQRFAMAAAATQIMEAMDFAAGDVHYSLSYVERKLLQLDGGNQAGLEAASYLSGLFFAEGVWDVDNSRFNASPTNSKIFDRLAEIQRELKQPLKRDEAYFKNKRLMEQAFNRRDDIIDRTLRENGNNYEKALRALSTRNGADARNAFRYVQGIVAFRDLNSK